LAIVRHDQCVAPAGVVVANLTMSATVSSLIDGLPPRPSPILPNPANPPTTNRLRHARTVTGVTPTSSAITALATPSAAINNAPGLQYLPMRRRPSPRQPLRDTPPEQPGEWNRHMRALADSVTDQARARRVSS
jgi:hypothetical protein